MNFDFQMENNKILKKSSELEANFTDNTSEKEFLR